MHWVYKLMYDTGAAPHVRDGLLSLAICKPKIRAGAATGDWIFGFGGRSRPAIGGERLIYIARITEKLARPGEYYERPEFRDRWDCVYERQGGCLTWRPGSLYHEKPESWDRDIGPAPTYPGAIVLLSKDFRYLGAEGTLKYACSWPALGTFVNEIGVGHRQVNPADPIGKDLAALQVQTWEARLRDPAPSPTEDDGKTPDWPNASRPASRRSSADRRGCGTRGCGT